MRRSTFLLASITIVVLGALAPSAVRQSSSSAERSRMKGVITRASWIHNPRSLEEITQLADTVIVADAIAVRRGRSLQRPKPFPPLEFQLVDFNYQQVLKGVAPATLTLERDSDSFGDRLVLEPADGGPFVVGATYLLFLVQKKDIGYWALINDQARYAVTADGLLSSASEGTLAGQLRGMPLATVTEMVRSTVRAR